MERLPTQLDGLVLLAPRKHGDERGFFMETFRADKAVEYGIPTAFVQDNHSRSRRGTIRGIHFQTHPGQGKLVRVSRGAVFDVAVDLRRGSATFGKSVSFNLDASSKRVAWIPPGFAHGFLVLSEQAEFLYKTTEYYAPEHERVLLWSDPALGIRWPLQAEPVLAERDRRGVPLASAEVYE